MCTQGALAKDQEQPDDVTIDARPCLNLTSPDARLACYEAQVGAALDKNRKAGSAPAGRTSDTRQGGRPSDAGQPDRSGSTEPPVPAPARESAPAAQAPRPAVLEPAKPVEQADAPLTRAERRANSRRNEAEREQAAIVSTVAALETRQPNQWLITFEDGHVWLQTRPSAYDLHVGDSVRMYSTRWGDAYRLTEDRLRGFILVKRIQ